MLNVTGVHHVDTTSQILDSICHYWVCSCSVGYSPINLTVFSSYMLTWNVFEGAKHGLPSVHIYLAQYPDHYTHVSLSDQTPVVIR